ncbi:MAG: hypothetical protein E6G91_09010 [Alphaproteobacteria bacterium]|jgi:hypothetical protein|nr:MAG: hypothetical protein E6G91_09010 [Alphaproteobacteria bacterium]
MSLQSEPYGNGRQREVAIEDTATLEPAGWRLSWGAVFAGMIVALVTHILLNLLGIGIGAASTDTARTPDGDTVQTVGILAGLWWAIAGIISAAVGGWFAGRTMGSSDRDDGLVHGLLSWAATTLVIAFVLSSVFGGALAGALGQFGDRVTQSLPQRQTQTTPPPTQSPNPAEAIKQATPPQREAARKAVSSSALASFVALLFGAVAAGFAGRRGVMAARRALNDD